MSGVLCLFDRGARRAVVDLHGEFAGADVGFAGAHLDHELGRDFFLEGAQRRERGAAILHHRIRAVVLGAELALFDALDRTNTDWRRMDDIVRGLLRTVLWLKTFPGLYAKVFLREDQAERTVFNFPDASKLTATKAELAWARHDLHGLLFGQ